MKDVKVILTINLNEPRLYVFWSQFYQVRVHHSTKSSLVAIEMSDDSLTIFALYETYIHRSIESWREKHNKKLNLPLETIPFHHTPPAQTKLTHQKPIQESLARSSSIETVEQNLYRICAVTFHPPLSLLFLFLLHVIDTLLANFIQIAF